MRNAGQDARGHRQDEGQLMNESFEWVILNVDLKRRSWAMILNGSSVLHATCLIR